MATPDYLTEAEFSPDYILVRQTLGPIETMAYHSDEDEIEDSIQHLKERRGGIWNLYKLVREDVTKPLA
jgi:hypothetical protein